MRGVGEMNAHEVSVVGGRRLPTPGGAAVRGSQDGAIAAQAEPYRPAVAGIDEVHRIEHAVGHARLLRGPVGAAVAGHEDDAAVPAVRLHAADGPAMLGVHEAHATQAPRRPRALRAPVRAAVGCRDDGAAVSDRPAVQRVHEAHACEADDRSRLLRDPGSAAVGGGDDRTAGPGGPAVSGVGEAHRCKVANRSRSLRRPSDAAVGGGHDGAPAADGPAVSDVDEVHAVERVAGHGTPLRQPVGRAVWGHGRALRRRHSEKGEAEDAGTKQSCPSATGDANCERPDGEDHHSAPPGGRGGRACFQVRKRGGPLLPCMPPRVTRRCAVAPV